MSGSYLRKKLCKLIALSLVLTLCSGCVQNFNPPGEENAAAYAPTSGGSSKNSVSTDNVSVDSASGVSSDVAEEEVGNDEGIKVIALYKSVEYYDESDEDGNTVAYGSCDRIGVSENGYARLEKSLELEYREEKETIIDTVSGYVKDIEEDSDKAWFDGEMLPYYSEYHAEAVRSDERVVSVLKLYNSYAGGAHPNYYYTAINLEPSTGKRLKISDIISDTDEFADAVEKEILKVVDREELLVDSVSGEVKKMIDDPDNYGELTYLLDYDGMEVIFSPYAITAYAAGSQKIRLNYEDYPKLIDQSYAERPLHYIEPVLDGLTYYAGSGKNKKTISFEENYDGGGYIGAFEIKLNGQGIEQNSYYYKSDIYLAHIGDKTYALIDKYSDNDYHYTDVFDVNSDKAVKLDTVDAGVDGTNMALNPDKLTLIIRSDLLSTYNVTALYSIDENGEFKPEEDFAYVVSEYPNHLKLKITKVAKMLDDEDGNSMHDVTMGSQTELIFYRTDLKNTVDFKLKDGNIVRFKVNSNGGDYGQSIDGEPIEEIFENLLFAG